MRNRCRRCCCMNNNYMTFNTKKECDNSDIIENACNNIRSGQNYNQTCDCGFDEEDNLFPENPMFAQSYVPIQTLNETFKPCVGLDKGTIFPELVSIYMPGDSMKQIKYIEKTNKIGEGCNLR